MHDQIDGEHPTVPPNGIEEGLIGLHLETRLTNRLVQDGKVDDGSPRSRSLHHNENEAEIPWRERGQLDRPFLNQRRDFPLAELSPW